MGDDQNSYSRALFNNRKLRTTLRLWRRVIRNRRYQGPLHFAFDIEGRRIVYA